MQRYFIVVAFACALAGATWDVRTRRIPNWLTYGGFLAGLVLRACFGGWRAVSYGLVAGLVAGGIFFLFFLVRAMGAGDVKLMAAVGCLAPSGVSSMGDALKQAVMIVLYSAMAGGILALGYTIFRRRVSRTFRNVWELVHHHLLFGVQSHPEINLHNPEAIRMPYALAIAAGTFYSLGTMLIQR